MAERKVKARYRTTGPHREMVTYQKCWLDDLKSLQQETVTEEMETYMVYFPQGHSIRLLGRKALEASGFHLKPRMVDMETGDVVDVGGDPYDFSDASIVIRDDDIEQLGSAKKRAA
jgi:hypothetical protein